ncbi:MAG: ribosome biogenesis GTPase Der [Coriobacteriales bacterium]|nr:ribosome biogenesis GTPase Der [Coriobacteriales bacterium]
MPLPVVAVVGRPNVGKSTFVNRIAQTQEAIVHEQRGVTRDRSYHHADWNGKEFIIVDTGGIEMSDDDRFIDSIRSQAFMAAEEADVVVFLVDGRTQITHDDQEVARFLKRAKTPTFLVVNKMDNPEDESAIWEFVSLGLGDPWPVSSVHGHGTGDLLDAIVAKLPDLPPDEETDAVSVAIIGRPNAGKSSLLNQMTGMQRSIVSDVAGTTRDALDAMVEHDGKSYRLVDTAGIRKKSAINESVEYYGYVRALRAIDRADVALLLIDSSIGLTDLDQKVAEIAKDRGCALIILLNKWDLIEDPEQRMRIQEKVGDRLTFVGYAPVQPISAKTGRSVSRIWAMIDQVAENHSQRIATNKLNNYLAEIREFGFMPSEGKKRLKMNYVTQTRTCPPTFTFFANHPELIDDSYSRFLENRLRERFDLVGTPVRFVFRKKD